MYDTTIEYHELKQGEEFEPMLQWGDPTQCDLHVLLSISSDVQVMQKQHH